MTQPVPGAARPAAWWLRVVFGVIGLIASVLGYVGLERLSQARPEAIADRYDILYYDLQLFFLSAELFEQPGPYPWQLQVARFMAPLFTLLAVAEAGRLLLATEIRRRRPGGPVATPSSAATRSSRTCSPTGCTPTVAGWSSYAPNRSGRWSTADAATSVSSAIRRTWRCCGVPACPGRTPSTPAPTTTTATTPSPTPPTG